MCNNDFTEPERMSVSGQRSRCSARFGVFVFSIATMAFAGCSSNDAPDHATDLADSGSDSGFSMQDADVSPMDPDVPVDMRVHLDSTRSDDVRDVPERDLGTNPELVKYSAILNQARAYAATGLEGLRAHRILMLPPVDLERGQAYVVSARALVQGPAASDQPILVAPAITCGPTTEMGWPVTWSMENWEGTSRQPEGVSVAVRATFAAQNNGPHGCILLLLSGAGIGVPEGTEMVARSGPDGTQLELMTGPAMFSESWETEAIEVLPNEVGTSLMRLFTTDAQSLTVYSDLQLSSCPPGAVSRGWCTVDGTMRTSNVTTQLSVIQLDDSGEPCARFESAERSTAIPNAAHHRKIFHELVVRPNTACSSQFEASTIVRVDSGNPVKVESRFESGPLSVGSAVGWAAR